MASFVRSRHSSRRRGGRIPTNVLKHTVNVGASTLPDVVRRERSDSLTKLGFTSYSGYMRSNLWKSIRDRVLERDDNKCVCGASASNVHHSEYNVATMSGDDLAHLHSLCAACHKIMHIVPWECRNPKNFNLVAARERREKRNKRKKNKNGKPRRFRRH